MSNKNTEHILTVRAIITFNGKVLAVRRSPTAKRAGKWEVPGGMVEPGENLEDAVKREVTEEVGIELNNVKFQFTSTYSYENQQRLSGVFAAEVDSDEVKLSFEHDKYQWIDENNYHNINWDTHYLEFFQDYFKTDEKQEVFDKYNTENTTYEHLIIYTDGGSRGNPGPSASGYVIMNEDEELLEEGGEYLGVTTNNQAEYQAVKLALKCAKKYNPKKVSFFIDSLLVVNQMIGKFKIKNRDLWPIHESIKKMAKDFDEVEFTHVRREFNKMADTKVNEVLDSYEHREKE